MSRTLTARARTRAGQAITEKAFQQQVVDLAKLLGWRHYHPFISVRSTPGFPDLVLMRERVVFAELKRDGADPTPAQQSWLDSLAAAGAEVYLWRPSDLDDIARILRRHQPATTPKEA